MAERVLYINVRPVWARAPLLLLAAAALAGSWYALRWGVGDTMAEYAPVSYASDPTAGFETEEGAARLAPDDPLAHLTLARLHRVSFDPDEIPRAFAELRRAADADPDRYRPQTFNLAWQIYNQDMPRVLDAVGRTPEARAQLVGVLVGRGRLEDAFTVWSSLGAQEKRQQGGAGEGLARALYNAGQYRRALQLLGEAGAAQDAAPERISNGGFESEIGQPGKQLFQWQVTPAAGAQAVLDSRGAHGGRRALRLLFYSSGQVDFHNVSQTVAVEPSARYRLTYFVRTDGVKTVATLYTLVSDAASESTALGQSGAAPAET